MLLVMWLVVVHHVLRVRNNSLSLISVVAFYWMKLDTRLLCILCIRSLVGFMLLLCCGTHAPVSHVFSAIRCSETNQSYFYVVLYCNTLYNLCDLINDNYVVAIFNKILFSECQIMQVFTCLNTCNTDCPWPRLRIRLSSAHKLGHSAIFPSHSRNKNS